MLEEGDTIIDKREDESSDEGELSDEEIERRRQLLKQKLLSKKKDEVNLLITLI